MMKKIMNQLPDDWLFQGVSLTLITTLTFYLFQYINELTFIANLWSNYEKAYIYTFLGIQIIVKLFFYWFLAFLFQNLIIRKIKRKISAVINQPKTVQDLRAISDLKKDIVSFFGLPLTLGIINKEDLLSPIDTDEEEYDLDSFMKSISKWCCLFIHLAVTCIIVIGLSAYYIVPLLIVILALIVAFWYGVYWVIGSAHIIERARREFIVTSKLSKKEEGNE